MAWSSKKFLCLHLTSLPLFLWVILGFLVLFLEHAALTCQKPKLPSLTAFFHGCSSCLLLLNKSPQNPRALTQFFLRSWFCGSAICWGCLFLLVLGGLTRVPVGSRWSAWWLCPHGGGWPSAESGGAGNPPLTTCWLIWVCSKHPEWKLRALLELTSRISTSSLPPHYIDPRKTSPPVFMEWGKKYKEREELRSAVDTGTVPKGYKSQLCSREMKHKTKQKQNRNLQLLLTTRNDKSETDDR